MSEGEIPKREAEIGRKTFSIYIKYLLVLFGRGRKGRERKRLSVSYIPGESISVRLWAASSEAQVSLSAPSPAADSPPRFVGLG